jgi:Rieske Fe-S protein
MADLLGDLSTRFGQMLSLSSVGNSPSLGDFLSALARSFASTAKATTNTGTVASTDPAAPAADAAAATPTATTATPAPYGQLLSFSATVRGQWLMAA